MIRDTALSTCWPGRSNLPEKISAQIGAYAHHAWLAAMAGMSAGHALSRWSCTMMRPGEASSSG